MNNNSSVPYVEINMHSDSNIPVKLYDLSAIYSISEKNPQFLEKLLLIFAENIKSDLLLFNNAADLGNWDEMSQLAHKMKPSLNHFGVKVLKNVLMRLERPANLNLNEIAFLVSELNRIVTEVLLGLKNEFPETFK